MKTVRTLFLAALLAVVYATISGYHSMALAGAFGCYYKGQQFSPDAAVCQAGTLFECDPDVSGKGYGWVMVGNHPKKC